MLLSYEVTSATDAKNYFASSISPGAEVDRHNYFSEGQESPGRYGGKLAGVLDLAGKVVDKATFDRLCDNRHPTENKPLTPRTNDYRRVCYDFTVSGPKSFSVIEAFASEEERQRLRHAFDESVEETVAEDMEPDMQCRERANGADHNITTGNVLTVAFDHATARPEDANTLPDPHWHKHLLIWNATQRPDGRILAGQFGDLVRDKPFYRAAFYARLASKLEAMGYVIDRRGGTEWEIAGVPQSVIDKFSKRTMQIEAEAEKRGITDEARKAELGAQIRAKKQKELTMPELRKAWDAQLTEGEREALAAVYRRDVPAGRDVTAAEAVEYAIAHCSEQLSVVPERELKRVAMLHGLGGVTPEAIAREMRSPRHGLIVEERDGRRVATTEQLQREEDAIVGFAARGKGSVAAVGVPEELERGRLNDEQWAAVTGLLDSENRVNVLIGPAGAGKTDLLKTYAEGMEQAGKTIGFLATSSDAVDVLHRDGFAEARTVAHFLLDQRLQESLRDGYVVCDEASMLGHKDALRFFQLADTLNLKVTMVGDAAQHGSVSRGALLRILKEYAGIREFKLKQIMRQQHDGYRAAATSLSEGRTLEGFDALDSLGWVKEIGPDGERYKELAAEYVRALEELKAVPEHQRVLCVSPTHKEAGLITQEIRSQLRAARKLGKDDHELIRLVAVNASEAERGQASTYRAGPLVLEFHQNAKGGFKKGDRLTVTDPAQVPLSEAAKFSLFRPVAEGFAVKDKIRFTHTVRTLDGKHTLKNGMVRTIAEITPGGKLRLDNGWVIGKDAGHFRKAYVETSFGSQGKTVHRVLLGMSAASLGAMNQEQMYVSGSRGKERLTLYTDDKGAVRSGIQRSSQKLAALDLKRTPPPAATPFRRHWERLRRHLDRQRRQGYFDRLRSVFHRNRQPAVARKEPLTHAERVQQQERGYGNER
jgi:conjugative relaxase-like TrwC/TraI family protein